jgi:F1F0 ATPase subunit 2
VIDVLLPLALGVMAGLGLGLAFFGGLWVTVKRAGAGGGGARAMFYVSFALRAAVALLVLMLLARRGLAPLLGALVGFAAARPLVTRAVAGREVPEPEVAAPAAAEEEARR